MRSRTNRINVWLSDEELADLNEKVSRVRGSRERFIRQCISGAAIREAPSVDVPKLIYEVRRVGASLNRILIIANAKGVAGSAGTPQSVRAEPRVGSTYRGRLHEGLTADEKHRTAIRPCGAYIVADNLFGVTVHARGKTTEISVPSPILLCRLRSA